MKTSKRKPLLRLHFWWKKRQIQKAVAACRSRMNHYTPEQRAELHAAAIQRMFPNGHWICQNGHVGVHIESGKSCTLCSTHQK